MFLWQCNSFYHFFIFSLVVYTFVFWWSLLKLALRRNVFQYNSWLCWLCWIHVIKIDVAPHKNLATGPRPHLCIFARNTKPVKVYVRTHVRKNYATVEINLSAIRFSTMSETEFELPVSFFVYPRLRKREFEIPFSFSVFLMHWKWISQLLSSFFVFPQYWTTEF